MKSSPTLRLIQLTDCHISRNPDDTFYGRNPVDTLKQVIDHIKQHETGIDAFITTGDISHDASTESYQHLAEQFALLSAPVISLPGNHDANPVFQNTMTSGELTTPGHVVLQHWLIILLDSTVPGEEGGRLSDAELSRLRGLLDQYHDKHVLIAVHHSPVNISSQWIDSMQIQNSDALFTLLKPHSHVRGILYGHIHQDYTATHHGIDVLSSPSTCHQFKPASTDFAIDDIAYGYRWLELSDTGNISTGVTRIGMGE